MILRTLRPLLLGLALGAALAPAAAETIEDNGLRLTREDRERMKGETVMAIRFIQSHHYSQRKFADISAQELIETYARDLDSSRLFLTQADIDEFLLRFETTIKPVFLGKGDLYPAFEIFNTYRRRALERIAWVQERLKGDFDFTTDQTFAPDRSEAPWPADGAEADAIWERRLTFELLGQLLNEEEIDRAKERLQRRYERTAKFVREIEVHNVQEVFLTSLAQLYDPHSSFFSAESAEEFSIAISNSLVGIGALLREEDGICHIQRLLPGGPAELSGELNPGDKIIAVAQGDEEPVDTIDLKLSKVVKMIRGPKGSIVRLTIIPAEAVDPSDPAERKIISLVRDEIQLTANLAEGSIHEVQRGEETIAVGVIDLPSFYGAGLNGEGASSTSADVEELLVKMKESDVAGIVLDLRRNGGGLLTEAIDLTGLFVPTGPVVMVRDADNRVDVSWDRNPKVAYAGPLVVLTSRNSASASEIVAGALQALDRAIVVGESSTHGKGTVQKPYSLANSFRLSFSRKPLGTVKITEQKFYLPNGDSTQNKGVIPDLVLPSANDFLLEGESDLPNALAWDEIDAVRWNPERTQVPGGPLFDDELLAKLAELSAERQQTLPEFAYLNKSIEFLQERHAREAFSLNIETRREQRQADRAVRDALDKEREKLVKANRETVERVTLALAEENERQHQEKLRTTPLPDGRLRPNAYYQKYYYHEDQEGFIHEIYVEHFDYEKAGKHAAEFAQILADRTGKEIDETQVGELLDHFKNVDGGSEFDVEGTFAEYLGQSLETADIEKVLPVFFRKMVEIDPEIVARHPSLDIHLRESLRIVADWVELRQERAEKAIAIKNVRATGTED